MLIKHFDVGDFKRAILSMLHVSLCHIVFKASPLHFCSRSRSPVRGGRREDRGPRSPQYSRSPRTSPPPSMDRKRGPSPDGSRSPKDEEAERNGSDYGQSPRMENSRSRSPMSQERSPRDRRYKSPEANGRSPSPRDEDDNNHESPKRSVSPS